MKKLFALLSLTVMTGCGTAYISSKVVDNDDVSIVEMTRVSVQAANASTYTPKDLPQVFFASAGGPSAGRGAGPLPPTAVDPERRPAALTLRVPPQPARRPYTIGVGDVLLLATRGNASTVEELSGLLAAQNRRQGYTVQDDGAIAIPEVGRVMVAGKTLEETEAELFQRLVENQIDPSFSVEIAEFNSQRVAIGGAVANPTVQAITLTDLTLDQALSAAGGINSKDLDYASIRIYRDGSLYQIPLENYLSEPQLQKLRLTAGDSVFVDTEYELERARAYFEEQIQLAQFRQTARTQALNELQAEMDIRRNALQEQRENFKDRMDLDGVDRDYVYLTGEVNTPSRYPMPFGRQSTLADALYSSGGFANNTGNPSQIYVLRGSDSAVAPVTAYRLDARNAVNLTLATLFEMRPNDIVFIAEQPITRWNRVVQQIVPTLLTSGAALASN
ncbi:polysaccharide biosynthesis/export family protein [Pseudooceanicola onchidii]|uniref:polysaccharide biosynthesis/export family protein n=1 Tax=Pseudooceanicola onchidii TaxID=2562279 RepID=UPI0010AA31B6|nr:polysaccharide biosynthesis/export family protein [Pseudooceanicola onchidii]